MSDLISREAQDVKHIKALTRIKENYERLWQENLTKEEDVKEEYDAVCAGIKAIESKDVLNKIKAEIEEYKLTIDNAISEDALKIEGIKEGYEDCLEIIDKYK